MADPVLQAELDIDAPPEKVWALVSDLSLMPRWSPQCRLMKTFGPLRAGAKTFNLNRRNLMFWPTTCQLTEVVPEQKLAFRVNGNNTVWSYELEPTATGTRVDRDRARRRTASTPVVEPRAGQRCLAACRASNENWSTGMNTSLRRIKAAAEGRQAP